MTRVLCALLASVTVAAASGAVAAASLLPEGITPVELEALPFEVDVGTTREVYEGGAGSIAAAVVGLRRAIHQNPGIMYDEYAASDIAYGTLRAIGIEDANIKRGLGITGMIAHIGAGSLESSVAGEVPTIVLRADMDALPIQEETDVPFKSTVPGVMHACGHDAHNAMLLGAAMALKRREAELIANGGAVRLFFQPAEEGGTGARRALVEGALNGATAAAMLHTNPEYEAGVIASKPGAVMAAEAELIIRVIGVGGHGAYPQTTTDPMIAATAVVAALNTIVSRRVDPAEAGVISVTMLRGNSHKHNIIPSEVEMRGTMRALSFEVMDFLIEEVERRAERVAAAYGCAVEIGPWLDTAVHRNSRGEEWSTPARLPPVVNDAAMVELGMGVYESIFPNATVLLDAAHMTGEDFSFLSDAMPSVFAWLGHRSPAHAVSERTGTNLHNSKMEVDETSLGRGATFLSSLALAYLSGAGPPGRAGEEL